MEFIASYLDRLNAIKSGYPFSRWQESGLHQYTEEACDAFASIFDSLIGRLAALGETAEEKDKIDLFKQAVESLNTLNEEDDSLIETGEREELCELCNKVAVAAGITPENYGDGEGPASEWRDW